MAKTPFDWSRFECELLEELCWSLARLGKKHPTETFYVVALYGVYRELDGPINLPLLAANTVGSPATADSDGLWSPRWNPPDWEHDELPTRKQPALRLERALEHEACAGSQGHWSKTEARYLKLLVRVARRLRDLAPELLTVSDDFIVFVHDDEGGADLARKTIPKRRFETLFASTVATQRERHAVAELAPDSRAAFLVTRFRCYEGVTTEDAQRELLALGATAVPPLLGVVEDAQVGWVAAKLLGEIGVVNPEILGKLRARAPSSLWHAMALGLLGDLEWLSEVATMEVALQGLAAPLKSIATRNRTPPLDYRPLETYLDRIGKPAVRCAERELAPGSGCVEIRADDVDEALRGMTSRYPVIRWHAASVLGDRGLGAAAGKRILPALAACLGDRNTRVRRVAIVSMSQWKAATKPFRDAIAAVRNDSDSTVRTIAAALLGNQR